jgi:hypothetical protein
MPDAPATREEIEAVNPTPSLLGHGQAYFRECGAAAERAKIANWLREDANRNDALARDWPASKKFHLMRANHLRDLADAIERREHRESRDGE